MASCGGAVRHSVMHTPPALPTCHLCTHPSKFVGNRRGYPFWRCSSCDLLFVDPLPTTTLDIYTDDYFSGATAGFGYVNYDADKAPMEASFVRYVTEIDSFLKTGERKLFDIGAATGFFLNIARNRGWQVSGVEPSSLASELARKKGLNVATGIFDENFPVPPGSLDVVTMWDVIEHVPNARETVKLIHRALKPGGVFAINTPDSGSLLARLLGLRWHLVVPPEHIVLFGRKSLRVLLESEGFTVEKTTCVGKRFSVQYVVQTLAHWQGYGIWKWLSRKLLDTRLGRIGVTINLRDNVTVFARRRG